MGLDDKILDNSIIKVYTDCQNILNLLERKDKLEKLDYISSTGKKIKNEKLYREFYKQNDKLNLKFIKVKGHKKLSLKGEIDILFNLVDKASRKALREFNKKGEL